MSPENTNPFVLPGMGQSGDLSQNPLLASMEMMRQAWQGFAGSGGPGQAGAAAPATLEDLERRIAELRTVENWLRMNLSMLTSSIQGLEVQRATIATFKSFMGAAPQAPDAKPASDGDPASAMPASAQAWWDMLQGQFNTLAAATMAGMQGAEAAKAGAGASGAAVKSAKPKTARKTAARKRGTSKS